MTFRILVVIMDPQQLEAIKITIHDLLDRAGHESIIHSASNVREARLNIKESSHRGYDLLVCHVNIPEDHKTPVNTDEKRGLLLLQELEKEGFDTPCILITLAPDASIFSVMQRMEHAGLVIEGEENMIEEFEFFCRKFLIEESLLEGNDPPETPQRIGKVDIILKPKQGGFLYAMKGINFKSKTCPDPDILQVDMIEIEELIGRSRRMEALKDERDWKDELLAIGKRILKELFEKNIDFNIGFKSLVSEVGGEEISEFVLSLRKTSTLWRLKH